MIRAWPNKKVHLEMDLRPVENGNRQSRDLSIHGTVDVGIGGKCVVSESSAYRLKAAQYNRLAEQAGTREARERMLRMERSYLLLAKNAEWLQDTDAFLRRQPGGHLTSPIRRG
jgi:hypothetical protein